MPDAIPPAPSEMIRRLNICLLRLVQCLLWQTTRKAAVCPLPCLPHLRPILSRFQLSRMRLMVELSPVVATGEIVLHGTSEIGHFAILLHRACNYTSRGQQLYCKEPAIILHRACTYTTQGLQLYPYFLYVGALFSPGGGLVFSRLGPCFLQAGALFSLG